MKATDGSPTIRFASWALPGAPLAGLVPAPGIGSDPAGPGWIPAALLVLVAIGLSVPLALTARALARSPERHDRSLFQALMILPIGVAGAALATGQAVVPGLLGAIAVALWVRTPGRDVRDVAFLVAAVAVGLAAGSQAPMIGAVVSAAVCLTALAVDRGLRRSGTTLPDTAPQTAPSTAHPRSRGSMPIQRFELPPELPVGALELAINPDLSALEFNARVLALAEDPRTPLLARLRFLAIVSGNLDEFFMVKVSGLQQAVAAGSAERSIDGGTPGEQLEAIGHRVRALVAAQYHCFDALHRGELAAHGIRIRGWSGLSPGEQAYLQTYFDQRVFPMLTPKAITDAPGHPFPVIEELRISLAVMTRDPRTQRDHLTHLKVTDALPRFVQLPGGCDFIALEDVIRANLTTLFPGREVRSAHPFRLTRSGEIQLDEASAVSFLEAVAQEVRRRPVNAVVRVEIEQAMPATVRESLLRELNDDAEQSFALRPEDLYPSPGPVDLGALTEVARLPLPALDYPPLPPTSPFPAGLPIFDLLDQRDLLVRYPWDSFADSVERFVAEAADDPDVAAIKLTLYRPGGPSVIGDALRRAAAAGKDVSVFVELKARFDEELNIHWARQLERAGIHVVTGLVSLKTHAKVILVVRRRGTELRRYAHIGTGNYNPQTARMYTDLGLFTANQDIGADLGALFNELTGSSRPPVGEFRRLIVAPTHMLGRFLALIERETARARAGEGGTIRAKLNGLSDSEIIEALYRASQAGVRIELVVRGICALRPGVPGLSDNIRVVSILGRFLEHARIYLFGEGTRAECHIGSADWRSRNLRRRVEVVVPIDDPALRARLDQMLEAELSDPERWELGADGCYTRPAQRTERPALGQA